jgi:murein DD-endopeptidase MepM/ murein hydrolase activator NlpD
MLLNRRTLGLAVSVWLANGLLPVSGRAGLFSSPPERPMASVGAPRPDATAAVPVTEVMRVRESLPVALVRSGLGIPEANRAAAALADDFDVVNPHPGLGLGLSIARMDSPVSERRLAVLTLAPRDNEELILTREADGSFRLRRIETPVFTTPSLTRGVVHGSLYLSFVEAGVEPDQAARIVDLFGRRVDLARDVASGDRFRLVFDQKRRADGQAVGARVLLYADLKTRTGGAQLYRFQPEGAREPRWIDGSGAQTTNGLLRTPVAGARLTSLFGMRLHPLLGFTRMHQGVDFGASVGTPVLAAGDGVVEEARWAGDYGRWLKIRHSADVETGYGHLSSWAPGVVPGARVRQGQIVAFVGASGLVTGPHLHYEVFEDGRRIDPRSARALSPPRTTAQDPDFRARKADIDAAVATLSAACAAPGLLAVSPAARCVG